MKIKTAISVLFLFLGWVGLTNAQVNTASVNAKEKLSQFLFEQKNGINTDAFIVIKDERVLFESYARGFGPSTKHLSWSMSKTIGGILIGQAMAEGYLKESDPIQKWLPAIQGDATVLDLLNMSSGLHFREEYAGVPVNSDATQMLYLTGPTMGFATYASTVPKLETVKPGHYFYYSSGDANLLMEVLRRALGDEVAYSEFPWKKFFKPLGIRSATFERDTKGTFVGSSYIYLTPMDYVKIGRLLMNRGQVEGQQLIPDWYFKQMTRVAPGVQEQPLVGTDPERAYSSQITTNQPITGRKLLSQYPDLPQDALILIGHQGQLVIASPSQKLVILRLAMDQKDNIDRQELFRRVAEFLKETGNKITTARDDFPNEYRNYLRPPHLKAPGKAQFVEYFKIPHLIRALAAKEMCSCTFVEKRTYDQCLDDLKTMLPILPRFSLKDGVVSARLGLGLQASKARFISEEFGCTLERSK